MKKNILTNIEKYYTDKIIEYGNTSQGVDWNSKDSQFMRFKILSEILPEKKEFSIIDFGCGYASLFEFLNSTKKQKFKFIGYDISKKMLEKAKELYPNEKRVEFINNIDKLPESDYLIASGIFNVKLQTLSVEWEKYIIDTLNLFNKKSKQGFSFNMLTSYSDKEYMKDNLYYADPLFIFDYCKRNFSKWVTLKHDYPLYEFSIFVVK